MTKLPVFSTIGQSMAVFGLHFGKLLRWILIPFFLGGGAIGVTIGLAAWMDAIGKGWNWWLLPVAPAILFAFQVGLPFAIRINQLAVMGRVEPAGYLEMIFSPRSFRYLGYCCSVSLIMVVGIALALAPGGLGTFLMEKGTIGAWGLLGVVVSVVLLVTFLILTIPLNLVFPAAAVERQPSLGRAYNLGEGCKWRLFVCIFLSALLFGLLSEGVEAVGRVFAPGNDKMVHLILLPLQILLGVFSYTTSVAVPAVAYRILSGLPDPRYEEVLPDSSASNPGGSAGESDPRDTPGSS